MRVFAVEREFGELRLTYAFLFLIEYYIVVVEKHTKPALHRTQSLGGVSWHRLVVHTEALLRPWHGRLPFLSNQRTQVTFTYYFSLTVFLGQN